MIDKNKKYSFKEALELIRKNSKSKFDATVELHLNISIDPKKNDQAFRFTTVLPHGTGKVLKVATLTSSKIEEADLDLSESDLDRIEKGTLKPNVDFDVLVTEPRFMPKIAKVARILGPAGIMPNPKSGTVSEDPKKAVEQIKKGKVEIRNEANAPIIHTVIGKLSFSDAALNENFEELITSLKQNKPQKVKPEFIVSAFITATMSPSVQLAL